MSLQSLEERISAEIEGEDLISVEGSIHFPLVLHIHQPVGNFPWVFGFAYEKSYEPLISALERHPNISAGLHITGPVLDWLESNQKEFLERVKTLVKRNQVEMLGGGYYEPILAMIPDRDKLAQMQLMANRLHELVGAKIKGFWLAERAWEPHLPPILARGNLEYVLIDDNHIRACGIEEPELLHVFATEDQGKSVAVFPINEQIRYLTPWKPAIETYKYLKGLVSKDDRERIITSIDDAEKFGTWPAGDRTTYDICYESGYDGFPWIDLWFGFLEQLPWVVSCTPGDFLAKFKPQRLVYLPTVSYDKMDRWALPTPARREVETLIEHLKWGRIFSVDIHEQKTDMNDVVRSHLRGGFWRHFLVKYPEANRLHKRMLLARRRILAAEKAQGYGPESFKEAWNEIYKAQCNDVLWHGLFAGVYYLFLRRETFRHILEAENILENKLGLEYIPLREADVEVPGHPEVILENQTLRVFIKPNGGCIIQEIDLKTESENISCVLTRREEAYHDKESELDLDRWQKASFRDWILPKSFSADDLLKCKMLDHYGVTSASYRTDFKEPGIVQFHYEGSLEGANFSIVKNFSLDPDSAKLSISYEVKAATELIDELRSFALCTEICLVIGDSLETLQIEKEKQRLLLSDSQSDLNVGVRCNRGSIAAVGPIITRLKSEGEWEPSYQGHSIFLCLPLEKLNENYPWIIELVF
ncbi:MAG: alpha-amylase/4-alpha-glucanotransferase domain-containing protein [Candidatus Hodarchaeota archaeon]